MPLTELSANQLCEHLTAVSVRNVELGSPLDSDQTSIAIHLSGGRTIVISALDESDPDDDPRDPTLRFETSVEDCRPFGVPNRAITDFLDEFAPGIGPGSLAHHRDTCEGCVDCD